MPKKKRRRKPHPPAHAGRSRHTTAPAGGRGGEPPLLDDVGRFLRGSHPLEMLQFASSLLAAVDPRRQDPLERAGGQTPELTLAELVGSFMDVRVPETTALLATIVELVDDELVERRIRHELAARKDRLPSWLQQLAPLTVDRALEMAHVLGDGDNVLLAARTANGDPLTVVLYIDHNLGTVAKDGFVIPEQVDGAVASFRSAAGDDPDVTFGEIGLADARSRITEAIELGAVTFPPFETETWPAARPLVEWVVRHLPEGGRGYERPEWTEADRESLTDRFFASEYGSDRDEEDRELFDSFLWFGCDYGPGDPLRWSPVAVEILLTDWLPRKVVADAAFLERAPDLLRRFIRFSHAERGIRPTLTAETLDAVDRWEPDYRRAVRSPRPQGPAALLAAMGAIGEEGADAPVWALGDVPTYEEQMLELLREAVGGDAVLQQLDATPLPEEPLDLSGVPGDVHARVTDVDALLDGCCRQLLDSEHRTACRRLLHDVAAAEPDIFRRRGRTDTVAAAIAWIVVKANHGFSQREGGLTAKALGEWFGIRGSPGQRAPTLLQALGIPPQRHADLLLGTPRYLVASRRRWIVETRNRWHAEG